MVQAYNPCTREAGAGGLWIPGQPGLQSRPCLKKNGGGGERMIRWYQGQEKWRAKKYAYV
jgi:hypothetical protein